MSWARYDDELSMNQKVGKLVALGVNGVAALGLHLLANTWCRHNGTTGVVDKHVPNLLVGRIGTKLARILTEVGMFDAHESGGWVIHDYAEFHDPNDPEPDKSAAQRKRELSAQRAEAGRKGGYAKAGKVSGKDIANADLASSKPVAELQQTSSPVPVPVPSVQVRDNSTPVDSHLPGRKSFDRINAVADNYARIAVEIRKPPPDHPAAFSTSARKTALNHPDLVRYLERWPDAPPDAIAAWLHGDKHSMGYYHDTHDDEVATVHPIRPTETTA